MNSNQEPEPQRPAQWEVPLRTPLFKWWVEKTVEDFAPTSIIETGALHGVGTTEIFVSTGLPVYSIEVHGDRVQDLIKKYALAPNFFPVHAWSTDESDGDPIYNNLLYDEGWEPSRCDALADLAKQALHEPTIFCLDTHWTMGFREFRVLFDLWHEEFLTSSWIIFLDDATNLKHKPTVRFIQQHPELQIPVIQRERWARILLAR